MSKGENYHERDNDGRARARMDFKTEILSLNEENHVVTMRMTPEPRRYDRVEKDDQTFFLDRYLGYLISEEDMNRAMKEQMSGLPLYALSPTIDSAPNYAASRRLVIGSELNGEPYTPPSEQAIQHREIDPQTNRKWLAFVSVDICSSSALRRSNRSEFEQVYAIFLRELGTVVGQFHGALLKTTGDGFIAYIDHPAFTRQSDNIVDLGLSFLVVVRDSINPALSEVGLPNLSIRVGADCGHADVRQITIPTTGYSDLDIASDALNRAVKIEQGADVNEFRIGRGLYELLHIDWLERAEEVEFDGTEVGIPDYKTYRMR